MKIVMLGNQARAMSNFWSILIRQLAGAGHEVVCCVPEPAAGDDPAWEQALGDLGVRLVHYPLDRKGLHPARDIKTLISLRKLFSLERPDLLFAFTIKPVIYGAFASALAGFPKKAQRNLMVTGLGFMFEGGSFIKNTLMQVARILYKLAFACAGTVFFQNDDDRKLFKKLSIITEKTHVCMSKGTGVDTRHFALAPAIVTPPVFLFIGRLLEAKGLRDFYTASVRVKARYPDARFCILGPMEQGVGSIPRSEVEQWQAEGVIEYLGETRDVRPYIADASAIILPSWREGTPCSLMEGMSMGRVVIAADAPGSREVVRDGVNGFLVPVRNAVALATAMEALILEPQYIADMGCRGRRIAEEEFDAVIVAQGIMRDMGIRTYP